MKTWLFFAPAFFLSSSLKIHKSKEFISGTARAQKLGSHKSKLVEKVSKTNN